MPTALEEARKILAARASQPKAMMLGLSNDLDAIGRALDWLNECITELKRRNRVLAKALIDRHYGYTSMTDVEFAAIEKIATADDAHKQTCNCEDCMRASMLKLDSMMRGL